LTLARPTISQLDPFLRNLNPVLQFVGMYQREITAFLGNDAAASQAQQTVLPGKSPQVGQAKQGHYLRAFATLTPDNLAYFPNKTDKTRSNAYPIPGWYDKLAEGLQVFDASPCGTIPVPQLSPTTQTDPTLGSIFNEINNIIYGGDSAQPLPAPACTQQSTAPYGGLYYPHVTRSATP
jgi:hypothetical protein